MRKINVWILSAIVCMLLTACGEELESPIIVEPSTIEKTPSASQAGSDDSNTASASTEQADPNDDTLPPDEGMVRSRLTNEWIYEDVANTRPIAVMTPNESAAIPHYNLSKASIIYEANVEGRMTRMLAFYEDWEDLE